MTDQNLRTKAQQIFDYLADVVKLGYKVIYDVQDHDDFLMTAADIEGVAELKFNQEFYLPQAELLALQRLENNSDSRDDSSSEQTTAVDTNHKLFDKLFNIKQRLQYEEKTELVLGYGVLLWEQEGKELRYPLLTRNVVIEHQPKENKIRVVAPDDAQWKLEVEPLIDVGATQLTALREKFNQLNDLANDNPYLDVLYEATGITAAGEVISSQQPAQESITETLQIVDDWVLFMRQRKQNEVLTDIEEFKKQVQDDSVALPDSIKKILADPEESNFEWENKDFHDQWSSYLDQEILFPKPANDEQVKILDCLEQSNGVVVQGPPGTGKSHTIANLLCHFMAQGEKVLVTSQKDQALQVLTDMIPEELQSLTMPVFQTDVHRKEKLEEVVTDISDIVSNQSYAQLKSDVEQLEEQFGTIKDRLEIVASDLQELAQAELEVKTARMKYSLPPAKAAKRVAHKQEQYSWWQDQPDYEVQKNDDRVELKSQFPVTSEEIETMKQLRRGLKPKLDELVQYEIPETDKLVNLQKYRIMAHQLKEAKELKSKIDHDYPDLVFKVTEEEVEELLDLIKETLNVYNQVSYSRSLNFIKQNQEAKTELESAITELGSIVQEITELQQRVGSTTKVDLDPRIKLEDYLEYVEEAIMRVKESKSAVSWLSIFNSTKKRALENVTINEHQVSKLEEWIRIKYYIELQLTIEEFITHWEGLENSFVGQLPDFSSQVTAKIKHNYDQLQQAFRYKYKLRPQLKARLDENIIGELDVEQRDFAEQLKDLYYVFKLKEEESNLNHAQQLFNEMKQELKIKQGQNGHPAVDKLIDCLNITEVEQLEDKIAQWSIYYKELSTLEELMPQYKKFKQLVDKLATQAPQWAEQWLDADYTVQELHLDQWREAWEHSVLESYLEEIIKRQEEIADLEEQQAQFQQQLTNLKRKMVLAKVKLKLKENTSQADINALKKWKHAVNRLGKGTGKNAAKWSNEAQKYMKKAKNAVPTWIMPLYRVSETITREMNSFDVLIIDEASQSNITALLALARAEKVIVVGDEKQISPSVVGISRDKIEVFIEQHLKDLANKNMMDLKTSLYDIAKASFDGRYNLMLKEHFRSLPEIIEFSNQNFYEGKILPLRNVREEERLKPTLENIYLADGEIDEQGKVNQREAEVICQKVKELTQSPLYQDKSFGVVSLKGKKQAEYIADKIDDYLTPQEQEEHNFLAGDAYTFQGDERDVMLLSMVVASNRRFRALTRTSSRQRFNVAVSRARDQVILVHSVKLEEELDNEDDMRYKLLDYIKNYQQLQQEKSPRECETQLEADVYQWLQEQGYEVTIKEQVGNHVLDLVVEGSQNRMAIECTGDQFYSPEQWWEAKRKQQQLTRVGWDIYNLQGANFYLNAEHCKKQLIKRLKNSLN